MSVTGSIRFLVGAGLVAGGAVLCAPLAGKLAAVAVTPVPVAPVPMAPLARGLDGHPIGPAPAAPVQQAPATSPAASVAPPQAGLPPLDWAATTETWPDPGSPALPDSAGGLQLDRCPPPPPAPLPPLPGEMTRACPTMGGAYRSTLDVPPPPLLDAERAPPPVTWAAAHAPAGPAPAAPDIGEVTVPATYRVRDGDDLGAIAARFYGTPAAASAIWAANRDTVAHPDLLPIDAELRLPPPWAARGHRRPAAGAIEPAAYARSVAAPVATGNPSRPEDPGPWLGPAAEVSQPRPTPEAAWNSPGGNSAGGPGSVVVAPGETLATLARRIYGDPGMAGQIFAANRDRLRGPELVVPGMELRLPRPVTPPRP